MSTMPEVRKTTTEVPNITLFRGWADSGNHVWSPFVIKLEARLRFAGVKYTTDSGSPLAAPKGKIPYIELRGQDISSFVDSGGEIKSSEWAIRTGDDGSHIASLGDSALIIKALTAPGLLPDINERLSPETKCHDMALRALLEDKLYFYHVRFCSSLQFPPHCASLVPTLRGLSKENELTCVRYYYNRQENAGLTTTTQCVTTPFGASLIPSVLWWAF